MFHLPNTSRRARSKGMVSGVALALSLACGAVIGTVGFTDSAHAASKAKFSKGWTKLGSEVETQFARIDKEPELAALANQIKAADPAARPALIAQLDARIEGAYSKLPTLVPLIETDLDRYQTGKFYLDFGNKFGDNSVVSTGLRYMIDSNQLEAAQIQQFTYYLGSFAWDAKDMVGTQNAMRKAFDLGYDGQNLERILFRSYVEQGRVAEGLAELGNLMDTRAARGWTQLDETVYREALQASIDANLSNEMVAWSANLTRNFPSPDSWNVAAQVLLASQKYGAQEALDVYRLVSLNDGLAASRDYIEYIEAADVRRMSNEVLPLIEAAIANGLLESTDIFAQETLTSARDRAPGDRADADSLAAQARTAANGVPARAAGDNFMSFQAWAKAEEMFKLAMEKGGGDNDRLLTRLGIVQTHQGNYAAARQSFSQVTGVRAPIATMWQAYIDTQMPAAPAPVAEAAAE